MILILIDDDFDEDDVDGKDDLDDDNTVLMNKS